MYDIIAIFTTNEFDNYCLSDKIIESINRLRNPIRLMNEEDKMKTVKYLQNLCKLSNSYIST